MTFRWFLWSLISPSQLLLFALALGAVLLFIGRDRIARALLLMGGLGLIVFGLLPTSLWLANRLETRFPARPTLPAEVTGIIVMAGAEKGASSQAYGQPQVGSAGGRYLTLLALAHRFPDARIVFTGDARREPGLGPLETQAAVAERIFADVGIDPARITWEDGSSDTCESGANTFALLQPKPGETWVLVSSALHMPRVVACFRSGGWTRQFVPYPADYRTTWGDFDTGSIQIAWNLDLFDEAAHEWLGLAFYRLTGRTQEWLPAPHRPI